MEPGPKSKHYTALVQRLFTIFSDLRSGSQSDIETRVGKPAKSNPIEVGRSAAEAGSRDAKIFVEPANRFLSHQADRLIPVFP